MNTELRARTHTYCMNAAELAYSSVSVCRSLDTHVHPHLRTRKHGDRQFLKDWYLGNLSAFPPVCVCVSVQSLVCMCVRGILQTETERLDFSKVITNHLHSSWPLGAQGLWPEGLQARIVSVSAAWERVVVVMVRSHPERVADT